MKLFRFEMSKLWRQKKFLWLFLIVLLGVGGIFTQNYLQQSKKGERAIENIEPYAKATDELYTELNGLYRENLLDEKQEKQYEYSNNMASALFHWKSAIYKGSWNEIPTHENEFLTNLLAFEDAGGEFTTLKGLKKERVILKNDWMLAHELSYEDEAYPVSPALMLKESTTILFGLLGILLLLLFFGNTITLEKGQNTWSTLKTQPIARWKLYAAKFATLLVIIAVFIVTVLGAGLGISLMFSDYAMNLQYPQIVTLGDAFTLISTYEYVTRGILLFICASTITFGLALVVSTWFRNTFSMLMVTGLIILLGFITTELTSVLQSVWNPFQYFRFSQIIAEIPGNLDWIYLLAAMIWTFLLIALAIVLPEKELSLFGSAENSKPFKRGETKKLFNLVWTISVFEWRKLLRNGLLMQLYLILTLTIIFGYFVITKQTQMKETSYLEGLEESVQFNAEYVIELEEELASFPELKKAAEESGDEAMAAYYGSDYGADHLKDILAYLDDLLSKEKAAIFAYELEDWTSFYEYQLYVNKLYQGEVDGIESGNTLRFSSEVSVAEKEWLMERDIKPVFMGEFVTTIHDHLDDEDDRDKEWEESNRKIDNSGLYSLYYYIDNYFYLIPLLLFLFLLGTGFSSERGKKETLQLLKTQPINEKKIYLGKGIQSTIVALLSSLGMFTIVILVATIFNRFGDWDYPILRYVSKRFMSATDFTGIRTFEGGGYFISLGNYLVESVTLFLITTLFLISVSIFLSIFLKSQLGVFATTILIGVVGYVGSHMFLTDKAHLSPFTYLNIPKIINGEFSALLNNPNITFQNGSLLLLASTLILFVLGYLLLSVRNKK